MKKFQVLRLHWNSALAVLITFPSLLFAGPSLHSLQNEWAHVNYELTGKAQLEAFSKLETEAEAFAEAHSESADGWIWSGIIKSSFAGRKGGLDGLSLAKKARVDLEKALAIDPLALNGSALTSLGTLYYSVPGWPIGYGDDKKAESLLKRSLEVNPDGIDSNYFYAGFLASKGDSDTARKYYQKAAMAPARAERSLADAGRQREIAEAIRELR